MPGEFCRVCRHAVSFSGTFGALVTGCARSYPLRNGLQAGVGGGFALHEALWLRVAGVSEPHVVQFPQSGGGEAGTRGGVVLTVQTTSEKSVENGLLWATWSALWVHRCLS